MVTKQLEVSREEVQLVDTPSTDWLILKHCFVGQKEAHMLAVVSFSAPFCYQTLEKKQSRGSLPLSSHTLLPNPYKAARFQVCLSAFVFQCWRKKKKTMERRTKNRILKE